MYTSRCFANANNNFCWREHCRILWITRDIKWYPGTLDEYSINDIVAGINEKHSMLRSASLSFQCVRERMTCLRDIKKDETTQRIERVAVTN